MARNAEAQAIEQQLKQMCEQLNQELLELSAREDLAPEEEKRLNALNSAVPDLEDAIAALEGRSFDRDDSDDDDEEELEDEMEADEPE